MSQEIVLEKWLNRLFNRLSALEDLRQRVILFANSISDLNPSDAASALRQILTAGFCRRDLPSRLAVEAAMLALAEDHWPKEHRSRINESEATLGDPLVCIYTSPIESLSTNEDNTSFRVPDYNSGRPLTLGERRSIASRPDRKLIEMAMRDPHPMVMSKLLDNPKLTEDDIVLIAARRPAPSEVLALVALSPRWRPSRRVAFALINNPAIPVLEALTLLPGLDRPSVSDIAVNERIDPLVRETAVEFLKLKKRKKLIPQNGR